MNSTIKDPVTEYRILDALESHEGDVTQSAVAKSVGLSVASVNFALRLLAVKGYIKIAGANRRNLRYHLTPAGILHKTVLAYNFLKRQSGLYETVRRRMLDTLGGLSARGINKVGVYGWTPLTESAILFLISEGVRVTAVYVDKLEDMPCASVNRIPFRLLGDADGDADAMVLMERPPADWVDARGASVIVCYPEGVVEERESPIPEMIPEGVSD
jgi:DNA-binding MarR family transcriptional regulator